MSSPPGSPRSPGSPGSPSSTTSSSVNSEDTSPPPIALSAFCGQWVEVPAEGQSLEPILRRLGLSQKKIEATLRGGTRQIVRLKGWELSTTYESELGRATDKHIVNGGRRTLAGNNGLTECKFEVEKPFPLRIASVLPAGRGTMRDKRSVKGSRMEQILEFYPEKEESPITVKRVWKRVSSPMDAVARRYTGVWTLDEARSESARPLLEASGYPKGAIDAAQQMLVRSLHSILLTAPGEVTLTNSVNGRTSSVVHVLSSRPPSSPEPGKVYCAIAGSSMIITSVAKSDGAMHTDERTIAQNGASFEQRLEYSKANVKISCVRHWSRVGDGVFLPGDDESMVTSTIRSSPFPPKGDRSPTETCV